MNLYGDSIYRMSYFVLQSDHDAFDLTTTENPKTTGYTSEQIGKYDDIDYISYYDMHGIIE